MQVQADPNQLRLTASRFSDCAHELRQKAKQLADLQSRMVQGQNSWKGEGAQGFTTTMEKLQNELQQKAGILEEAAQILLPFATQMDHVNQMRNQARSLEQMLGSIAGDSESAMHERQSISFQINQLMQEAEWQAHAADAQATSTLNSLSISMPDFQADIQSPSLLDEIGDAIKKAYDFVGGAMYAVADDLTMGLLDQVLPDDADQRSAVYQQGKVIGDEISVGVGVVTAIDGLVQAVGGAAAGLLFSETGVGALAGVAVAAEGVMQAAAGGLEAFHAYTKLEDDKQMLDNTLEEESQGNPSTNGSEPTEVEYGDQFTTDGRKKVLKPNIKYTTPEGYTYTTDGQGRIASVEGKLELGTAKRNQYAQRKVGRKNGLPTDDGGHLIASIFKGSGDIDNLVPMDANLNRSEYKALENTWKKALAENKEVTVSIEPIYKSDSLRPDRFGISYEIDGEYRKVWLKNHEGGKNSGN